MSRDLNDTLLFAKVVEKGSFTAAAQVLGVPKATLSRKVQELEQRLGARLLKRTTRRLGLTEAGSVYYEHATRIARDLDDAESAVGQLNGTPRGWLRFTAPYTLGTDSVAPLLPEFMERYPDLRVEMQLTNERMDLVASEMDLAVRIGDLEDSSLIARKLATINLFVYASPEYLERHGEPLQPSDLEHHRTLTGTKHRRGNRFYWPLSNDGTTLEVPLAPVLAVNDPSSISQALLAGAGVALMPETYTKAAAAHGCVRRILVPWAGPQVDLNAVYPPGRMHAPKVRAFVDFLVERLDLHNLGMRVPANCS